MPNDTYSQAIKEAMASAKKSDPILETLEIYHGSFAETLWLIRNNEDLTLTLEDDTQQDFEAVGFQLKLPDTGAKGLQELTIQIDNVDRRVTEFIASTRDLSGPIMVRYRVYLGSDLTTPQNDPPMQLALVDIKISELRVSAKAKFANVLGAAFPKSIYTRSRFPGLGG